MTPKERFQFVKLSNLCVNCLSYKLWTVISFKICKKRRHTALHFDSTVNNEVQLNYAVTLIARNKPSNNNSTSSKLATSVLLSTAEVFTYDNKNNQVAIRCLIDCVSQ